ncbi:peptidase M16 [Prosthecochloris sp. GSB1]|uniref:M16 family metallopeptidase n=1 Tax=Prosthecochloris sp. GSB1 TaxID=281093 RepID=UPI000B8D0DC8|nr:pitrilysin family protein [Prosthecochloris sp. GSB1]ASQ91262.1 peptidase M16 [Prosthecochloris sp. GSB1]
MRLKDSSTIVSAGPVFEDILPGGLRVFSNHVPHVQSITLGIWINAGSREDPKDMAGLAHFLEHAVFKGTRTRDYLEIARCIEEVGGYIDAYTTKENTCIYIRCLREHAALAFSLLADLTGSPVFPDDELEKEKEVVIEEIHGIDDTPEELIFDRFDTLAFPRHPLGPAILGTEESIEKITPQALRRFMQRHYVPENMVLTTVGNISREEVLRQAEKHFSGFSKNRGSANRDRSFSSDDYAAFSAREEKPLSQGHVLYGLAAPRDDAFFFGLMLLNTVLSGGMSSRLNIELREKEALAYNAYSSLSLFDDVTLFNIYAGTDADNIAKAVSIMEKMLDPEKLSEIDRKEFLAAKNKLQGAFVMGMEKMTRRMSKAARDIFYFGRHIGIEEKLAGIEALDAEDLGSAAAYLRQSAGASLLVYEPGGEEED